MKKVVSFVLALIITASLLCVGASAQSSELTVEEEIFNGLSNFKENIYIADYEIKADDIQNLYGDIRHLYPSMFHIGNSFRYSCYSRNGQDYVYSIYPVYNITQTEYAKRLRIFNFWISEIAGKVSENATELEKVLFVHEYFAEHFEYDYSYSIYDAYNFIKYKKGVCQAYTIAFTAVMQKLGVFCTAAIDDGDNHCWNVVKLGDNYYHIDITHDDGKYILNGCELSDHCGRDHLLLSDATMETLPLHRKGWYTVGGDFKCTDASYENNLWGDYEHPSSYVNGAWYQVFQGGFVQKGYEVFYTAQLYKTDKDNNKTLFKTFDIPALKVGTSYSSCNYNIFSVGDVIFGGGGNYIWRYSFSKDKFEFIYNTNKNIFEISYMGGGKIKLAIRNDDGTYSFEEYNFTMGDSDDNGSVDVNDMVSLKKYLLLHESDKNVGFMDLNGDCFVDVLDFIAINKTLVK